MKKTGLLAAVAAVAMLAGEPALGDTDRRPLEPFPDGSFIAVDDDALDREVGLGLAGGDLPQAANAEGRRMAVILWDEARPPGTPPPTRNHAQDNGRVVVSVGRGTVPGS